MTKALILFSALMTAPAANALSVIGTPGCYLLKGRVHKVKPADILFLTQAGMRGEQMVEVRLGRYVKNRPQNLAEPGADAVLLVYATRGLASRNEIRLESAHVTLVERTETFEDTWNWVGALGADSRCPLPAGWPKDPPPATNKKNTKSPKRSL